MALVQRTHLLRLRFRDNDLAESTCEINLSSGVGLSSALTFLASWRAIVISLSSATCTDADLIVRYVEPAPASAGAGSDCLRSGTFILDTATADLAVVRVPSIDVTMLESSGPYAGIRVDQTITAIIDFVAALTSGIGGVEPCDPFASDLVIIDQAFKEQF